MPELHKSVVVITGASSGIGRCTALALARAGAKLALAARNQKALEQVAKECRKLGGEAIAVECDVTKEDEVWDLAEQAADEFGNIDVWINNAGVGLYGKFEEVPSESYRHQLETNLFGVIHGARAALKQFRIQGGRGILIDVSSQVAAGGIPYQSGFAAAKSAVRMFDDTLRQELQDSPEIRVCTVLPSSTDTPFFERAGNYSGKALRPVGKISHPDEVAKAIVNLIGHPEREAFIGTHGYFMGAAHAVRPDTYNRMARKFADRKHFEKAQAQTTDGSLFEPNGPEQTSGGWKKEARGSKVPLIAALGGMGVAAVAVLLTRRARSRPVTTSEAA
jgi:short-subunit dehydrogenase